MPLFSIVMPTYNRALTIGRAIESVIAQTFTDWELIVVDDGSVDDTKAVVAQYGDERIRYIYQENAERSAARNNGINNAQGDYICFIDSDDYYFDNHLFAFYSFLKEHNFPTALVFGQTCVDLDGVVSQEPFTAKPTEKPTEFFIVNIVGVPRTCISRSILLEEQFDPAIRIGEDMVLWTRIARKYPFYYIPDYTQAYVEHTGRSVSASEKPFVEHINTLLYIFKQYSLDEIGAGVRAHALAYGYFRYAQYWQGQHNYGKMLKMLWKSYQASPAYRQKERLYMAIAESWPYKMLKGKK